MRRPVLALSGLALTALVVSETLDADGRWSWMAGLVDPILGLDHLVVLVGVGLWAGKLGGSAPRRLPTAFLAGGLAGFLLAGGQPPVPLLEALIRLLVIASVLLVGLALMFPVNVPRREATSTVAVVGACHGYLHRLEVGTAQALWFGLGAVVTAAALMAVGLAFAMNEPNAR